MNKIKIIVGALIILGLGAILWRVSQTSTTTSTAQSPSENNRIRQDPESLNRLATGPQKIKTVITTTGRAENANWGIKGVGSFVLTYALDCDAEIEEKEKTPGGEIKVVERRTFHQCRQQLEVFDTDVRLSLYDTLPLEGLFGVIKCVGELFESPLIGEGADIVDETFKSIDGTSAVKCLEAVGVDIKPIQNVIDTVVTTTVSGLLKTMDIEGKSYRITYYQDKDTGKPLRVIFTYADGSPVKSVEECLVLRRANAFLDAQAVPDKNCHPGDTWTVDTSGFECLLDPYVDGAYCGDVTVERLKDDSDGDWRVGLKPCNVYMKSDAGRTTGEINLTSGEAKVDADNVFVKAMQVSGKGHLKNLTPHHLLFNSRFEGDCEFRGVMTTERLPTSSRK